MIKKLEKRYGISIVDDSYYYMGKFYKRYAVYTADGCRWDCGLSYHGLLDMIKSDKLDLLKIKEKVEKHC